MKINENHTTYRGQVRTYLSSREVAEKLGVSRKTIDAVFDELTPEARTSSGWPLWDAGRLWEIKEAIESKAKRKRKEKP